MSSKPSTPSTAAATSGGKDAEQKKEQQPALQKGFSLEEDDEFEDFPVEDWEDTETEVPGGKANLWEDSWDDDDTSEDFSSQLREELKKVGGK
ncbi:DSS1/SEM1 family-domain-containing protein [Peziza echinospora]|nr:DSS1/SEM1 family-domain-containing protein [Peziza echinospora]